MKGINLSILRQYASKSFDILLNRKELDIEDFSELIEIIKENNVLKVFLEEMLMLLHQKIPGYNKSEYNISFHILSEWNVLIHKAISNRMTYNQNTRLIFETLLYQMRDVI